MRLVADTPEDFLTFSLLQRQITQMFKAEKGTGSGLESAYKKYINTPIEKAYERVGESVQNVSIDANMDTEERELIIPYIVHAALSRKKIAVEYRDAKGNVSKRVLEPYAWRNGQLSAFCHERGAWRSFKPANIVRIAVTDDSFEMSEIVEIQPADAKDMAFLI